MAGSMSLRYKVISVRTNPAPKVRQQCFLVEIKPDLMFYGIDFQSLCGLVVMVYSISAIGFSLKIAARVTG